jgi:diguanylate cyclase (GGDEF)-like protein
MLSAQRAWQRFGAEHLHDFPREARRYWLMLVLIGLGVLLWAGVHVFTMPQHVLLQVLLCTGMAVVAGCFPIPLARGGVESYVGGVVFIFLLLWTHGAAAAVFADAFACMAVAMRLHTRWSQRLVLPAVTVIGSMPVAVACEALFTRTLANTAVHWPTAVPTALFMGAVMVLVARLLLNALQALQRGMRLDHRTAFEGMLVPLVIGALSAVAALFFVQALLAGSFTLIGSWAALALTVHLSLFLWVTHRYAQSDARDHRRRATERHMEALNRVAYHDGLTELPNRRRFQEHLQASILRARAAPDHHFALMFIDCDDFKDINDSFGHAAGDEFLKVVSRRVREHLRGVDFVARWGGDEFAVILQPCDSVEQAQTIAQRMIESMQAPVVVNGVGMTSTVSIGITFNTHGEHGAEQLLRDADLAMYRAKDRGKGCAVVFDEALREESRQRALLTTELGEALAQCRLDIAYQPLYRLPKRELLGFEALARWTHPKLGAVSPTTFVAMAEELGLIGDLTAYVLRRATSELARWTRDDPKNLSNLQMHVNVSARDLGNPAFLTMVQDALEVSALDPRRLVIEITETALVENIEKAMKSLTALRRLGVGVAVDDFGTGYSSLSRLAQMPITCFKIDAAFVNALKPGKQAEIVRVIIALGRTLNKHVIAEGIETESQLAMLGTLGCEGGQGFVLSRPLDTASVDRMLEHIAPHALSSELVTPGWMDSTFTGAQALH